MEAKIKDILKNIEQEHQVKILYACESGSRAWGFASPDSDYDVRFIYAHPKERYLQIDELRDVIELPVDKVLDVNGWDIRKALRLFRKSNAPLLEWLQSPIVYQRDVTFHEAMISLAKDYFSARASTHHYLSMARNSFAELQSEQVRIKKYFYALRPVLACKWIREQHTQPPIQFDQLRTLISNDTTLSTELDALLVLKAQAVEQATTRRIAVLHEFIAREIQATLDHLDTLTERTGATEPLNQIFNTILQ